ncbi:Uma2 family endonuclease [uncultured Imperialibacter sp.]|uniref:Uma2 family endonuclease n=1 Tax=uncultured Imperialibacter sp. TaxID=1672639 RepID=UPI0030D84BE9
MRNTTMEGLVINRTKEWTASDYQLLGESAAPCQLIDGELFMSPSPTPEHQRVVRRLFKILDSFAASAGEVFFSPIDLYVDDRNVFQPDLIYIAESNANAFTTKGVEKAPDLIVEIISPSNSYVDRYTKKKAYLEMGVKEYWIVDPANQTLEVFSDDLDVVDKPSFFLSQSGIVSSRVIPMLKFNLEDIWS